jgi:hypothetical protein
MSGDVIAAVMAREATRRLVTEPPPRESPPRRLAENGHASHEPEPARTRPAADTA